jgi:hypothetical protein
MPEHIEHARRELVLAVGAGGVAHHLLLVTQLVIEQQRVGPVEAHVGLGSHLMGAYQSADKSSNGLYSSV